MNGMYANTSLTMAQAAWISAHRICLHEPMFGSKWTEARHVADRALYQMTPEQRLQACHIYLDLDPYPASVAGRDTA